MFERLGEIVYPLAAGSPDEVMEAAIDAGAEDVESDAPSTDPDDDAGAHHLFRRSRT